jgi:hypothetical protein
MASIRRRGATWHVQTRRKDHTPVCKAFAERRDAEVWARETERKHDRGEDLTSTAFGRSALQRCMAPMARRGDLQ